MPTRRVMIGVGGRFTADRMAVAFASAGHDVHVVTSLPRSRFLSLSNVKVSSFVFPELVFQIGKRLGYENSADLFKMKRFGARFAKAVEQADPEVVFGWSSFSKEAFHCSKNFRRVLVRESSHIDIQNEILREEFAHLGQSLPDRRGCWEREREEYRIADRILVCSEFARKSFLEKGVTGEKIEKISLGVDTSLFSAALGTEKREAGPLRVVYFGNISIRKGVRYLLEATKPFAPGEVNLTLIGPVEPGYEKVLSKYSHASYRPAMSHAQLAEALPEFDVFVLPSLEDGFGLVVPQAMASGLVPIVTDRCGSSEIIENGKTGLVIEGASVQAIRNALEKLLGDRRRVSEMRSESLKAVRGFGWDAYGASLNRFLEGLVG